MTIELITGTPGAGKTTYAVARRLKVELDREFSYGDDEAACSGVAPGTKVKRRLVQSGIKGLLLDHERIPHTLTGEAVGEKEVAFWNEQGEDGNPVWKRLPGERAWDASAFSDASAKSPGVKREWFRPSLFNWWLWCEPGDLIAVDEVQYIVPRGTMGKKPPLFIALLEIHRHYGIDLLFITQHPGLLDSTIKALVGMHSHVRSVMGSGTCAVYKWDHASNVERYSMATKTMFRRGPEDYALFKSSTLHVKPPAAGRGAMVMVALLLISAIVLAVYVRNRMHPDKPVSLMSSANAAEVPPRARVAAVVGTEKRSTRPAGFVDVPELSGCWSVGDQCRCMDRNSRPVLVNAPMCHASASSFDGLVEWQPRAAPTNTNYGAGAGSGSQQSAPVPSAPASSPTLFAGR